MKDHRPELHSEWVLVHDLMPRCCETLLIAGDRVEVWANPSPNRLIVRMLTRYPNSLHAVKRSSFRRAIGMCR